MSIVKLERRVRRVERELSKILKVLELVPSIHISEWKELTDLDKEILKVLLEKKFAGETTTKIAERLQLPNPKVSGRVTVYVRLKKIAKISERLKGAPIVLSEEKRWKLNFDEFNFIEESK